MYTKKKKNYNGTQCITFCNDGTAAHGNGPFKKPQSDILVRMRDYDNFVHLEAEPEDWSPCHCYPTKEVPGRLISYFFNEWLFIPDYSEEEQTQASHPSPNKGKPVYRVLNLPHGGRMRKARVSGDTKLELTLLKNGKLADLGELVQDLMTAYENLAFELEMEEMENLCEPAA